MVSKEMESLELLRLSKKLNDYIIDLRSKKHQVYISKFSK